MGKIGYTYMYSNASPARVKLTPNGFAEEYSVSPPPFVKGQTISISNIPNMKSGFDHIAESFSGSRVASAPVVPLPAPPPKTIPKASASTSPVKSDVVPPQATPPAKNDSGTDASSKTKYSFTDDLKTNWVYYSLGILVGGGIGGAIANKYKSKYNTLAILGGAGAIFGLTWLYFNVYDEQAEVEDDRSSKSTSKVDMVANKFVKLTKKVKMRFPKRKLKMLKKMLANKPTADLDRMNRELDVLLSKSDKEAEEGLEGFLLDNLSD